MVIRMPAKNMYIHTRQTPSEVRATLESLNRMEKCDETDGRDHLQKTLGLLPLPALD